MLDQKQFGTYLHVLEQNYFLVCLIHVQISFLKLQSIFQNEVSRSTYIFTNNSLRIQILQFLSNSIDCLIGTSINLRLLK